MFSKLRKLVGKDEEVRKADGQLAEQSDGGQNGNRALQPHLQVKFGRGVQYNMVGDGEKWPIRDFVSWKRKF